MSSIGPILLLNYIFRVCVKRLARVAHYIILILYRMIITQYTHTHTHTVVIIRPRGEGAIRPLAVMTI